MNVSATGYERDSRIIPGHHQPAVLIDLALSRDLDPHRILRGTGLFYEDLGSGQVRISPAQMLRLIDNAETLLGAADSSFLFGQRLLPGHYGPASDALNHACTLLQALELLCEFHALLTPLLTPRLMIDEQQAHLYWLDSCGAGGQRRFLLEASLTAVVAMARRLSGERLPWRFQFDYPRPRHIEQYWVHLGEELAFDAQMPLMSLPLACLQRRLPNASLTAGRVAEAACRAERDARGGASLLDLLYRHLRGRLRQSPSLEDVAAAFAMSPASLKRRLARHGTCFQLQLDLARKHEALYLLWIKGASNEQVASQLGFTDPTNFRRSFKRWTGQTPSGLRGAFAALLR